MIELLTELHQRRRATVEALWNANSGFSEEDLKRLAAIQGAITAVEAEINTNHRDQVAPWPIA